MMESLRNKGEKSNTMQMLNMFPEADGVMFVSMGYDFVKKQFLLQQESKHTLKLNYGTEKEKSFCYS